MSIETNTSATPLPQRMIEDMRARTLAAVSKPTVAGQVDDSGSSHLTASGCAF